MHTTTWEGVFPAMLTPFTKDDKLDFALFEKNITAQAAAGSEGLIVGGSLGEASTLANEEKIKLLVFASEILKGKGPVVLTIAEQATAIAHSMVQHESSTDLEKILTEITQLDGDELERLLKNRRP